MNRYEKFAPEFRGTGRLQTRTSKVQIRFHFISIIDPQFEFWNVKYLPSFLLFREDSSLLDEDNCHASLPVKVFNSQKICILQFKVSGWLTREDFTSPKRKIKKFKILHKRNYIKNTNGKYPKLWWIWKMGYFQTLSRKFKKKISITDFTRVDFKLFSKSEKLFKLLSKKFSKLRHTIRFYNLKNIRFLGKEFENHHLAFQILKVLKNFKTSHF